MKHCNREMKIVEGSYCKVSKTIATMTMKCVVCGITKSHAVTLKG